MEPVLSEDSLIAKSDVMYYRLKPFAWAEQAMRRCWSEGVYLTEIFFRFFKLHLQIIARCKRWLDDALNIIGDYNENMCTKLKMNRTALLVSLYADVKRFIGVSEQHRDQLVLQNLPINLDETQITVIKNAVMKTFEVLQQSLNERLIRIQSMLVERMIAECGLENLRQVNDLPRLYRKTNREVPTRCSTYVDQVLAPLKSFHAKEIISKQLSPEITKLIITEVLQKVFDELVSS